MNKFEITYPFVFPLLYHKHIIGMFVIKFESIYVSKLYCLFSFTLYRFKLVFAKFA